MTRFSQRCRGNQGWWSRKPSSVRPEGRTIISLGWRSPATSRGLPAAQTVRAEPRRLFGLAPTGGCRAATVASRAVGFYPTVSPLPTGRTGRRFVFCGPVRRLAAPRRYLAVCPAELGLSSTRLAASRDRHAPPLPAPGKILVLGAAVRLRRRARRMGERW